MPHHPETSNDLLGGWVWDLVVCGERPGLAERVKGSGRGKSRRGERKGCATAEHAIFGRLNASNRATQLCSQQRSMCKHKALFTCSSGVQAQPLLLTLSPSITTRAPGTARTTSAPSTLRFLIVMCAPSSSRTDRGDSSRPP